MAVREKILKMSQHIAGRDKLYTEAYPEYYVFHDLVTDEQADVVIAMKRRFEEKVEDIAERVGKGYSETFDICMQLTDMGILELKPQSDGTDTFELPIFVPGIY